MDDAQRFQLNPRARRVGAALSASLFLLPSLGSANTMTGLVYIGLLWPVAAVLILFMAISWILAGVIALRKGARSGYPKYGAFMVYAGHTANALFAVVAMFAELEFSDFETIVPTVLHIAFFQLFAIPTVLLGRRVQRKAKTFTEADRENGSTDA